MDRWIVVACALLLGSATLLVTPRSLAAGAVLLGELPAGTLFGREIAAPHDETEHRQQLRLRFLPAGPKAQSTRLAGDQPVRAAVLAYTPTEAPAAVYIDQQARLWRQPVDGQEQTLLDAGPVLELSASADGRRLAWIRGDAAMPEPYGDLWVLPEPAAAPTALTFGPAPRSLPTFSPSGNAVLVVSAESSVASLWWHPLRVGGERQLTNAGLRAGEPLGPRFVPPPIATPLWHANQLVYDAGDSLWSIEIEKSEVRATPLLDRRCQAISWAEPARSVRCLLGKGEVRLVYLPIKVTP